MSERQRARINVSGRVQGVFFRDSARQQADRLGLSGWVKNLPDGQVEVVADGEPQKVRELAQWCESGPPEARVEEVQVDYEPVPEDGPTEFDVR